MKYIRKHKQLIEESWFSDISIPNNPISNSLKGTELSIDISISDLSNSYKLNTNNEYISTLVTRIAGHVIENYIVKKLGLSYTSSVLDGSREENGQTVEYEIKAYKDSFSSFLKMFSQQQIDYICDENDSQDKKVLIVRYSNKNNAPNKIIIRDVFLISKEKFIKYCKSKETSK